MSNGLLAAAAFANDGESRKQMREAMDAVADHLARRKHLPGDATSTAGLIQTLSSEGKSSHDLQRATDEALAYLAYLKRFATKSDNNQG